MLTRRGFLTAAAAGVGIGLAAQPAAASTDLTDWLANTDGAGEVVDRTGTSTVELTVGASGNGGAFGFGPPVVRVDPGTTVRWTWTGKGGSHNVVASDGRFESPMQSNQGATFEHTVEQAGVTTYYCAPHKAMGMRGALVVGDATVTLPGSGNPTPTATPEPTETDATTEKPSFGGWLADTSNYDGVHDRRGADEVTVKVGAEGNGGPLAFEPAAVHVDPGTVVRFEWVGPRRYDVVDPELGIESKQVASEGHEFALRFDGDGVSTYGCTEYGDQGMRGVVLVGDGPQETLSWTGVGAAGATGVGLTGLAGYAFHLNDRTATKSDE